MQTWRQAGLVVKLNHAMLLLRAYNSELNKNGGKNHCEKRWVAREKGALQQNIETRETCQQSAESQEIVAIQHDLFNCSREHSFRNTP